jgi:hypothetical protein
MLRYLWSEERLRRLAELWPDPTWTTARSRANSAWGSIRCFFERKSWVLRVG